MNGGIARAPRLLITRPKGEAEGFERVLDALGFESVIQPMLDIEPVFFDEPDLQDIQGLIFTSAQAVRFFCDVVDERDLSIYAVGRRTAQALRDQGFQRIFDADGTSDDLVGLIEREVSGASKALLHIRGEYIAEPLDQIFAQRGVRLDSVIVYTARKVERFSLGFSLDDIDAVTFFSRRTAEAFMALVAQSEIREKLRHIKALCISDAVLKCVQPDVQDDIWEQAYVAEMPNTQGMEALLRRIYKSDILPDLLEDTKTMPMTNNKLTTSIDNAAAVIERFGGIRPMAKKVNVAVTTIQGWKKRNTIPAARREQILEAALSHEVDLSDIVPGVSDVPASVSVANENVVVMDSESTAEAEVEVEAPTETAQDVTPSADVRAEKLIVRHEDGGEDVSQVASPRAHAPQRDGDLAAKLAATEKNAVTKSTWINFILILIVIAAAAVLLWPSSNGGSDDRLSSLESDVGGLRDDVSAVQAEQSFLSTLIPHDLDQRIANLQDQARLTQEKLGTVIEQAGDVTSEIFAEDLNFDQRFAIIGGHASEFAYSPQIASVLERFTTLNQTVSGQTQLSSSVSEINALFLNLAGVGGAGDGGAAFDEALAEARGQSSALNETFEGVPGEDMKAAALLLGMTQLRSSLNRDNQPFDEDLELLINLMGKDNPALVASIEKLGPHAEEGVLTPGGLIAEFRTLAGETVVSSLKGEDVSFTDKAKARFNDVFQVEKDGELLTGTPVQASVAKAQSLLEAGDISGAIAQMEALDGEPREKIEPWLNDARATVLAQDLHKVMGDGVSEISSGVAAGQGRLIQDKATGINIYIRPQSDLGTPKSSNAFQ